MARTRKMAPAVRGAINAHQHPVLHHQQHHHGFIVATAKDLGRQIEYPDDRITIFHTIAMTRLIVEKSSAVLPPRIRSRSDNCHLPSRLRHLPKYFIVMMILTTVLAKPRASAAAAATRRFEAAAMVFGVRVSRQAPMAYVPSSLNILFDASTSPCGSNHGVHYFPMRMQRPRVLPKRSVTILHERSYSHQSEDDLAQPQARRRKTKRPIQLPTKESHETRQRATTSHRNTASHQARKPTRQKSTPQLETPQIIFSNNHLLVCNKPPGWKSQPGDGGGKSSSSQSNNNNNNVDPKCLLTYLQSQQLGGGSLQNFLIPTHRLDQPCTGVLIFAKNGKAASRVQVAWGKRQVEKEYWVIVEGGNAGGGMDGLEVLRYQSKKLNEEGVFRLSALIQTKPPNGMSIGGKSNSVAGGGGSVSVKPIPRNYNPKDESNTGNGRVCHIEWRHLLALPTPSNPSSSQTDPRIPTRHLLSVKTDTGAKHQVRALLALAGETPIAGDLRYGNNLRGQGGGRVDGPLPDGSVALHARSVFLPTVSLGGMEFLKDEPFVADIPNRWMDFFGICEDDVKGLQV